MHENAGCLKAALSDANLFLTIFDLLQLFIVVPAVRTVEDKNVRRDAVGNEAPRATNPGADKRL